MSKLYMHSQTLHPILSHPLRKFAICSTLTGRKIPGAIMKTAGRYSKLGPNVSLFGLLVMTTIQTPSQSSFLLNFWELFIIDLIWVKIMALSLLAVSYTNFNLTPNRDKHPVTVHGSRFYCTLNFLIAPMADAVLL